MSNKLDDFTVIPSRYSDDGPECPWDIARREQERERARIAKLRNSIRSKENTMCYFLMNQASEWVMVDKQTYDHAPDDMINNKASIDSEALVTLDVANIGLHELCDLIRVFKVWLSSVA